MLLEFPAFPGIAMKYNHTKPLFTPQLETQLQTMNMCRHDLRTINELAASFAKREGVEALVLAGSTATGLADEDSDYDLYAYTSETVPVEFRAQLLKPRAARLELHNTFWEWSDEWVEPALPLISCTARATPLKRTWKPSLAKARPRWATQRAFATRCCKPRRCSIAGVGSKPSRTGSNRPRTRIDSWRGLSR